MKTTKHYLSKLPSPFKEEALANADAEDLEALAATPFDALFGAFTWQLSDQGHAYWKEFSLTLEGHEEVFINNDKV
jgi:hypothetical protein